MSNIVSVADYIARYAQGNTYNNAEKPLFPKTFSWLLSDYLGNKWEVSDPGSTENTRTVYLNFDGPMIGGGLLSDHSYFIADAKMALVLAVECRALSAGRKVQSLSMMTSFVNCHKRIFNELICLGFTTWQEWETSLNDKLLKRLVFKAPISQRYLYRIKAYVEEAGIENLPIKSFDKNKNPPRVDAAKIYAQLGINPHAAGVNQEIQAYWEDINIQLGEIYPELKIGVIDKHFEGIDLKSKVHEKQFKDCLATIEMISAYSNMLPDLFEDPWLVSIVDDINARIADANFNSANGRTRNIPVPVFLKLMDAASRYVLDYADSLFKAEEVLARKYSELEDQYGNYLTGKHINGFARNLGKMIGGLYTPFPLAAYKQYQVRETRIAEDNLDALRELLASGVRPKEIMAELDISKPQFDYRRQIVEGSTLYRRDLPHTGISLQKALYQFLPLSCLLIIFSFSARRESEVFGMETGCYKQCTEGWKIKFYVAKTERKHEWFTTVPLVIKAIKILERLSEKGRLKSGTDSIFRFDDLFDRAPTNFDRLVSCAESFMDYIGIEHDAGNRLKLSEHQFRRFFARMYFYRYNLGGDYESLMHELRHKDWTMTSIYLTEKEFGRAFKEVEQEFIADNALLALEGSDGVAGAMAAELKEKLAAVVNVVPEKRHELAVRHLEPDSLKIDFISEGLCFGNTPGKKSLSNCYSDGHVMCQRASENMCKGCPNLLSVESIKQDRRSESMHDDDLGESMILSAALESQ